MTDAFVKIKPTEPCRLSKQAARRNRKWSDSSGSSWVRADASRWACKKIKRLKSSYRRSEVSTANEKKSDWVWSIQTNFSAVTILNPDHFLWSTIRIRNTVWTPCVCELTNRVQMWTPEPSIPHGEIYNQSVRRRKTVDLCLGFLQDYIALYLIITPLFASSRRYLVDLHFMTLRIE